MTNFRFFALVLRSRNCNGNDIKPHPQFTSLVGVEIALPDLPKPPLFFRVYRGFGICVLTFTSCFDFDNRKFPCGLIENDDVPLPYRTAIISGENF